MPSTSGILGPRGRDAPVTEDARGCANAEIRAQRPLGQRSSQNNRDAVASLACGKGVEAQLAAQTSEAKQPMAGANYKT